MCIEPRVDIGLNLSVTRGPVCYLGGGRPGLVGDTDHGPGCGARHRRKRRIPVHAVLAVFAVGSGLPLPIKGGFCPGVLEMRIEISVVESCFFSEVQIESVGVGHLGGLRDGDRLAGAVLPVEGSAVGVVSDRAGDGERLRCRGLNLIHQRGGGRLRAFPDRGAAGENDPEGGDVRAHHDAAIRPGPVKVQKKRMGRLPQKLPGNGDRLAVDQNIPHQRSGGKNRRDGKPGPFFGERDVQRFTDAALRQKPLLPDFQTISFYLCKHGSDISFLKM